ncbi:MAG TPA: YciI family protein [Gaiellaceae bacterium]|nr:YciI family protein [Gaiellaceae bacterium]
MSPRFAYLYFMKDDPDHVRAAAPDHVSHWHRLRLDGYLGGPFEDRSGGLIIFESADDEAQTAVESDPFVRSELLERYWLKQWMPQ